MSAPQKWDRLASLIDQGMTAREAAVALGQPISSTRKAATRMGLSFDRSDNDDAPPVLGEAAYLQALYRAHVAEFPWLYERRRA